MENYKLEITPTAGKQYLKIASKVPQADQEKLWQQVKKELETNPYPEKQKPKTKKKLLGKNNKTGLHRLREELKAHTLRFVYLIDEEEKIVTIVHIAQRKDIDYAEIVKRFGKV